MELKNQSKETRQLLINIFLSVVIKGGSLLVSLISTPNYFRYLDDNIVLGLWFTLYSMLSGC